MDLKGKKMLIFGLNGSGKTVWAKKQIRDNFKQPLIWCNPEHIKDWDKEPRGFIYSPTAMSEQGELLELKEFITGLKRVQTDTTGNYKPYDCVVFDDFDSIVNRQSLPYELKDLNANNRVWKDLTVIFIIRRPEQLNTDIVETCHYLVAFAIEGENTLSKLKNISKEFEIKVRQLVFGDYRCVVKPHGLMPYFEEKVKIK